MKNELHNVLKPEFDNASGGAQVVKYLYGFIYVVLFNFITVSFGAILAILYFLSALSFFVSSVGKYKANPFAFHEHIK